MGGREETKWGVCAFLFSFVNLASVRTLCHNFCGDYTLKWLKASISCKMLLDRREWRGKLLVTILPSDDCYRGTGCEGKRPFAFENPAFTSRWVLEYEVSPSIPVAV